MTFPKSFALWDGTRRSHSDDVLILQMAIDNQAASVNKYTKLQLSTHIIVLFLYFAWATTGELVSDGITPFNIMFTSEGSAHAVTCQVNKLVAVEPGSAAMSYADAEIFMVDESTFLTDIMQCGYCLEAHSIMVDLMTGEAAPFTMAY